MTQAGKRPDGVDLERVREPPDRSSVPNLDSVRIKIRIDFYPAFGELDFSFIAWHHPDSHLIRNELWSHYDQAHIGMAALDITAMIYAAIREIPDPFP